VVRTNVNGFVDVCANSRPVERKAKSGRIRRSRARAIWSSLEKMVGRCTPESSREWETWTGWRACARTLGWRIPNRRH